MKFVIILAALCVGTVLAAPGLHSYNLEYCSSDKCKLPDCRCSYEKKPIQGKIPQFVMMSFNDAAAQLIFDSFWEKTLFNAKNPDGCPISGTFFVPHEYSSYAVVNKLYNHGFEIGVHSITKNGTVDYWKDASKELIKKEMGGQRDIIAPYANIPKDKIRGGRIPLLQINTHTFEGMKEGELIYDASWPTRQENTFFPYTLDYASDQICQIESECFIDPVTGFWIIPITDLVSQKGIVCNSLLGCQTVGTADEIFEWLKQNFEKIYNDSRTPFSLIVDYAWYSSAQTHQDAFALFMKYLSEHKDVYLISHGQLLDWIKNPTLEFTSCQTIENAPCTPVSCSWVVGDTTKYMVSCISCPKEYPWLPK